MLYARILKRAKDNDGIFYEYFSDLIPLKTNDLYTAKRRLKGIVNHGLHTRILPVAFIADKSGDPVENMVAGKWAEETDDFRSEKKPEFYRRFYAKAIADQAKSLDLTVFVSKSYNNHVLAKNKDFILKTYNDKDGSENSIVIIDEKKEIDVSKMKLRSYSRCDDLEIHYLSETGKKDFYRLKGSYFIFSLSGVVVFQKR